MGAPPRRRRDLVSMRSEWRTSEWLVRARMCVSSERGTGVGRGRSNRGIERGVGASYEQDCVTVLELGELVEGGGCFLGG